MKHKKEWNTVARLIAEADIDKRSFNNQLSITDIGRKTYSGIGSVHEFMCGDRIFWITLADLEVND